MDLDANKCYEYIYTGCPVPDVGFGYFIDLYQMLEMIDSLLIYHTRIIYSRTIFVWFENTWMNSLLWAPLVSFITSKLRSSAEVFWGGSPCGVWSRGLNFCILYVCTFSDKFILNKLVCNFDRMDKVLFFTHTHIYIYTNIYIFVYIYI